MPELDCFKYYEDLLNTTIIALEIVREECVEQDLPILVRDIDGYTLPTLRKYLNSGRQPGSVEVMRKHIEKEKPKEDLSIEDPISEEE